MSTIDTLADQHRAVLAHLDEIRPGVVVSVGRLEALLAFLRDEVEEHLGLEEDALFPLLARRPQLEAGPLAVMAAEHEELRALVAELEAALRTDRSAESAAVAAAIAALLRAHIDKEDHVLFPLAVALLSAAECVEVEARAAARERRDGGRPRAKR